MSIESILQRRFNNVRIQYEFDKTELFKLKEKMEEAESDLNEYYLLVEKVKSWGTEHTNTELNFNTVFVMLVV